MKTLDQHLKRVQTVQMEGIFRKFLEMVEDKHPKHPKWKIMQQMFRTAAIRCENMHPQNVSEPGFSWTYNEYNENPKMVRCQYLARADYLLRFLAWAKEDGEDGVCKFNRNKTKCKAWVRTFSMKAENEILDIKGMLERSPRLSSTQYSRVQKVVG
ncbi:MAG: hypothetical protein ACTSWJ_08685 [Candidatus Heimdallarchaeaceae archaeon]